MQKKSQSSKPLRIISSYPPNCSHALLRTICVARQLLSKRNAVTSPPQSAGQQLPERQMYADMRMSLLWMDFRIMLYLPPPQRRFPVYRLRPATNTTEACASRMPAFLAEETPLFGWLITSTGMGKLQPASISFKICKDT